MRGEGVGSVLRSAHLVVMELADREVSTKNSLLQMDPSDYNLVKLQTALREGACT